ncbi:hypothetical protein [Deinococcus cellulosilyticus]|uniref:Uncharacterized protein n=1 Tax=Deinococcus cellulosilyticus (strain DSM 18568 / NBRC 106333 / KACC 11606 / 5516J-15) TaxID=1223518 RepID=A0A511MUU0_DEIC1|nr:hypothetical protein [Deinococcus cellulosilyticus]GEM44375.1 hypothetical protein DC3_00100 [Deinococcus cellulosilyticus NBRC 106333 = KACC 11606]
MLNKEHYPSPEVVPIHYATPAQLRLLGLCEQGLEPIGTVSTRGKTLPLYLISQAFPERTPVRY